MPQVDSKLPDSKSPDSKSPDSKPPNFKPRIPWPFILIVAAIILPVIAANLVYYTGIGVSEKTVNEGKLLEPPVKLSILTGAAEQPEHIWRLLLPITAPCGEDCQRNLYITRQVHIRLGGDGQRVERIAVNLAGEAGKDFLQELHDEHPRLTHIAATRADWDTWLAGTNAPANLEQAPYYLLVDPQGFAMMFYTVENSGNDLLDDINRVLRYTLE